MNGGPHRRVRPRRARCSTSPTDEYTKALLADTPTLEDVVVS